MVGQVVTGPKAEGVSKKLLIGESPVVALQPGDIDTGYVRLSPEGVGVMMGLPLSW